mmetsp:Transcript_13225/g.26353  ORF Transcript_13225/g.26353 Transcript_13225/m.26353 type:complete len:104 (-) Transcript_13225:619-930(-)
MQCMERVRYHKIKAICEMKTSKGQGRNSALGCVSLSLHGTLLFCQCFDFFFFFRSDLDNIPGSRSRQICLAFQMYQPRVYTKEEGRRRTLSASLSPFLGLSIS